MKNCMKTLKSCLKILLGLFDNVFSNISRLVGREHNGFLVRASASYSSNDKSENAEHMQVEQGCRRTREGGNPLRPRLEHKIGKYIGIRKKNPSIPK